MSYRRILQFISGKKGVTILPFLVGTLYSYYKFRSIDPLNLILLFIALLFLEEGIAGLTGYFIKDEKPISTGDITEKYRRKKRTPNIGLLFLLLYLALTVTLSVRAGFFVFLLMIIILLQGTFYRGGPIPTVRTHRSEFTTGLTLGLIVPLTAVIVHLEDKLLKAWIFQTKFHFEADLKSLGMVLIVMIPLVTALTDLVLTDNIIDINVDKKEGRFTLPILLGKDRALLLFNFIYILGAVSVLVSIITKSLPIAGLLMALPYSLVFKNARIFSGRSHRERGNYLAQENFVVVTVTLLIVLALGINFNL
ncbi:MAG: UbiA family prenyltransferase [Clostridiaceae bacterium]